MTDLKKCYSRDNESFNCLDFDVLIDGYDEQPSVGDTYWEADCRTATPLDAINSHTVDSILECMDDQMGDHLDECYDYECSDVTDAAKIELRSLIESWAGRHIDLSRFWIIEGNSRECKFTEDDLS